MLKTYYRPLTGLRALAALLVFLTHSSPLRLLTNSPILLALDFSIGVNIFFVLSGFLIALRYAEQASTKLVFWQKYLINRLARIYPIWFLLSTIALIWRINHLGGSNLVTELLHYLANLTFLKGFSNTLQFTLIQQGWTLTVEESFYLLAPMLLICWRRGAPAWVVFGGAATALLAAGAMLVELLHGRIEGFFSDYYLLLGWTLAGRCGEFFAGAALALWLVRRGKIPTCATGWFSWMGLAGTLAVLLVVALAHIHHLNEILIQVGLVQLLLTLPLVALLYGLLTEVTWISRVLGSRTAVVLGKSSYIFYLIHMGPVHDAIHGGRPVWLSLPAILADLVLLSALSIVGYYTLEAPLNGFIRRHLAM